MSRYKKTKKDPNFDLDTEAKTEEIERQRLEQEIAIRRQADDEIRKLKLKIKFAKQKSRELDRKFLAQKKNYTDQKQFWAEYKQHQEKKQAIIHDLETQLANQKQQYRENFEAGGFKIKRWFYGLGREFSRITWLDRKGLGWGFLTVFIISLTLAVIFLIIDVIFGVGGF